MTPTAADAIAKRIINLWTGGPKLTEWVDALVPLDEGTAGTALIRLRNELEHAPSIARFLATYRSLNTAYNDPPPAWNDGPVMPPSDPRAQAAFNRGYPQGLADRTAMSVCRCDWCRQHFGLLDNRPAQEGAA